MAARIPCAFFLLFSSLLLVRSRRTLVRFFATVDASMAVRQLGMSSFARLMASEMASSRLRISSGSGS